MKLSERLKQLQVEAGKARQGNLPETLAHFLVGREDAFLEARKLAEEYEDQTKNKLRKS